MLPIILGGVALATVGYGVKVCFDEQEDLKDELRRCKREHLQQQQELPKPSEFDIQKSEFETLYKDKHKIRDGFEEEYDLVICSQEEIKEERLEQGVILDSKIMMNLQNYQYLIKVISEKIVKIKEEESEEDLSAYTEILKKLFITKIIKKGELNKKSNKVILEAMKMINEE